MTDGEVVQFVVRSRTDAALHSSQRSFPDERIAQVEKLRPTGPGFFYVPVVCIR